MTNKRVGIQTLVDGSWKKLSKSTRTKIKTIAIEKGKEAAVRFLCNIIKSKTGIDDEICTKVATKIVNKLILEIRKKIRKSN